MTTAKPLSEIIDPSWASALAPVEPTIHEIGKRLREEVASLRQELEDKPTLGESLRSAATAPTRAARRLFKRG